MTPEMNDAAPWRMWPIDDHAQRIALMLSGVDDEDEQDAIAEQYLTDIVDDMIRAGCSADVAGDWTCDIAGAAGVLQCDLRHAGGHRAGSA